MRDSRDLSQTLTKLCLSGQKPGSVLFSRVFKISNLFRFIAAFNAECPDDPPNSPDPHSELGEREIKRIEADTYCSINSPYVWCLPRDYNRAKHPFICKTT